MSSSAQDSAAAQLAAYRRRHQGEAGNDDVPPPPPAAELVADLLPSPPASVAGSSSNTAPAVPHTPAAAPAPRGPVRVSQLRNRVCWICSEGDAEDAAAATPSAASSGGSTPTTAGAATQPPRPRRRRWIHPCGCSLVAHEACLRRWVRHSQARKAPVRCPQCVQPYELHERRSIVLALGERLEALTSRALPLLAAASAGSALLVAGTAYGCAAIRVFAGPGAARRMLDRKWPWNYYIDIPLIPIALIVSRVEARGMPALLTWYIGMHFPNLFVYLPFRGIGYAQHMNRVQRAQFESLTNPFYGRGSWWPLPPSVMLVAMPWIRFLYLDLKLHLTRWLLAPHARRPRAPAAAGNQPRRRIREIVLTDGQPMVDVPGQEGVRDVGIGTDGLPRPVPAGVAAIDDLGRRPEGLAAEDDDNDDDEEDEIAEGADAAHGPNAARGADRRLVYVTPASLGRLVLGALALPFVGSAVGSVLAMLARRSGSSLMMRILGMRPASPTTSFASTPSTSSSAPRRSPFASIFYGGSDSSAAATAAAPQPTADSSSWLWSKLNSRARAAAAPESALAPEWQEEDAVWLRSVIGASLCIVVKDLAQLAYRAARLRQARDRSSLTVADKPFAESMRSELDIQE